MQEHEPEDQEEFEFDPKAKVQELLKNAVVGGLSAVFMTEDSIRKFIKEKKIPKEWAHDLLSLAGRRKEDFMGLIGKEVSHFFKHIDIQQELENFFKKHSINFSAKVDFEPKKKESNTDV